MIPFKYEWKSLEHEKAFVDRINSKLPEGRFAIDYKLVAPKKFTPRGARKIVRVQVTDDEGLAPYWTELNFNKLIKEIKDY